VSSDRDRRRQEREDRRAERNGPAEPIWLRPEPGARRPRYTRDQIAETALAIADAEGFEAVSMRRVASQLGAGTMTLYHYVRNKDELIALVDDALMGELLIPDGELPSDWREALRAIARRTRGVFLRHPWAFGAKRDSQGGGPNGMRHFEQSLAAVANLDVDDELRLEIITMVDDYVFGYVLRGSTDEDTWDEETLEQANEFVRTQLSTGEYPQIERIFGSDADMRETWGRFIALMRDEQRFERGLNRLLDGIALDVSADPRPTAARPGRPAASR
jgi:AcrR family transcriptional regulator